MNKIVLYWNIASQPARAVKALLDIGKIPHQQVVIDLPSLIARKPSSKSFLDINPLGTIPTIKDGDHILTESGAIMAYLCQKYPQRIPSSYYPSDLIKKSLVNQYISWYQSAFRPAFMQIITLKIYGKLHRKQNFTNEQIQVAEERMQHQLNVLNNIIKRNGNKYICGNQIRIIDLLVFFELTNYMYYDKTWQHHLQVDQWFKRMYGVPEVKNITHSWFSGVAQFKQLLSSQQPIQTVGKL